MPKEMDAMSEFYTVTQYAEVFGKDPGNIRRMLIGGKLKGEKVGNQWLIPKDASYPDDRRVKSGDYRNWRQRVQLGSRHPNVVKKLCKMCEDIGSIYAGSIQEVLLYGSYAKGSETEESDIDMALMLDFDQTEEQYEKLTDIVVDYELDLGITLSIVPIVLREYAEWKATLPFYKNLEKEGIVLWKSV